jgi:PHD/YefM family antitoxin component YafN of YafNO toxin-antitoxin module
VGEWVPSRRPRDTRSAKLRYHWRLNGCREQKLTLNGVTKRDRFDPLLCLARSGTRSRSRAGVSAPEKRAAGGYAMTITTLSSRELNHDVTRAKKAANNGPVFIIDRGKPAYVLLSFEAYQKLTQQRRNIANTRVMPGVEDIEFNPPRANVQTRPADLT